MRTEGGREFIFLLSLHSSVFRPSELVQVRDGGFHPRLAHELEPGETKLRVDVNDPPGTTVAGASNYVTNTRKDGGMKMEGGRRIRG